MKKALLVLILLVVAGVSTAFAQDDNRGPRRDDIREKIEDRREDREEKRDEKKGTTIMAFTAEQITCLKNALTKREDALIAGHTAYSTSIAKAFADRKTALIAAMDKAPAERREAVRTADRAFKDATRTARKTWETTRRAAWMTFTTDRKACFPQTTSQSVGSSDTGGSKSDASL